MVPNFHIVRTQGPAIGMLSNRALQYEQRGKFGPPSLTVRRAWRGSSYYAIIIGGAQHMLAIRIDNERQHSFHYHSTGQLLLGRQPQEEDAHVVIDDDYVSRRQLRLDHASQSLVRFENLGVNDLELADGRRVAQGDAVDTPLPSSIRIGRTTIRLEWTPSNEPGCDTSTEPPAAHPLQTYSRPTGDEVDSFYSTSLASLGQAPSAEKLTFWFETLLTVQRSAVGSTEFYQETAEAIVQLVGLNRGMVLIREGGSWKIVATAADDEATSGDYSTLVLDQVVKRKQTFSANPETLSARASLASLEAVVASPIFDEQGEVAGVLFGSRDLRPGALRLEVSPLEAQVVQLLASSISAGLLRQKMEQRLKQAEQLAAVGQAIGYIIHDLRGPLGNTQQLVDMLRCDDETGISRDDQLGFIKDSVDISLNLLNDCLEFCRGQVHVQPQLGRFKDLFDKHFRLLKLSLDKYGVELQIDATDDLQLMVDAERMARVLRNLAKNAGEALKDRNGAIVQIGARATPQSTQIWVADNGPGMPPEVLDNLFQPFATHGKKGGTGFGLAIAKQLVEAHRGSIGVSSSDQGTRFTITLPPASQSPSCSPINELDAQDPSNSPTIGHSQQQISTIRPLRILVAEDVAMNRRLMQGILNGQGHFVTVVPDGQQAVTTWETGHFDVLLLDLEMPVMTGLEACRAIRAAERQRGGRTLIVALSGHESEEARKQVNEAGMDHFLTKPLGLAEFNRIVALGR